MGMGTPCGSCDRLEWLDECEGFVLSDDMLEGVQLESDENDGVQAGGACDQHGLGVLVSGQVEYSPLAFPIKQSKFEQKFVQKCPYHIMNTKATRGSAYSTQILYFLYFCNFFRFDGK